MKRLLPPIVTALLTFFGSLIFMQIWERGYPKSTLSTTSTLINRTVTEEEWLKVRLAFAEDEFWRCITPRKLVTAAEAEKQQRECYAALDKTRRAILQGNK